MYSRAAFGMSFSCIEPALPLSFNSVPTNGRESQARFLTQHLYAVSWISFREGTRLWVTMSGSSRSAASGRTVIAPSGGEAIFSAMERAGTSSKKSLTGLSGRSGLLSISLKISRSFRVNSSLPLEIANRIHATHSCQDRTEYHRGLAQRLWFDRPMRAVLLVRRIR